MWPFTWITFLILLTKTQAIPTHFSNSDMNDCSLCKPGYFVLSHCTEDKDTVCSPCPKGTFNHRFNLGDKCNSCSKCGPSLFELKHCTKTSDVFCESCASKTHKHLKTYLEFCLGYDADVVNIQADDTFVNKLDNDNNIKREDKTDITKHYSDGVNGEILAASTERGDEQPLENLVALPQKEAEEEELLPVFSTETPIDGNYSLFKYKGLSLNGDNNYEGSGFEGSGIDVFIKTTPLLEDIPSSGEGEIIVMDYGEDNDTVDSVVIWGTDRYRTFPPEENKKGDSDGELVLNPADESSADESRDLDKIHTVAADNRKRAAIIVGVAIGSVALFTVGFLLSRHYRKKRTFRINQKIQSSVDNYTNGSKEALEFEDLSKNSRIYTRTTMSNKNGNYSKIDGIGSNVVKEDLYAVPLKREFRPKSGSEADKYVNGIDRMKYMDDTDNEEDGASENLLPKENQHGESENQSTSLSEVVLDKLDQRLSPIEEEEKAPMLPKS